MKDNFENISIEQIGSKNEIKNFYPFTTKDDRFDKQYSFDEIIGLFISFISSKKIQQLQFEEFKKKCIDTFSQYIDDNEAIDLLEELYFKDNAINIDSLLVKQTITPQNRSKKVFEIFREFIYNKEISVNFESNSNFLEQIILEQLKKEFKADNIKISNTSYLPFLEQFFTKDLEFLNTNKHYFSKNLESFLELYLFIYCSQLALNLQPVENALSVPFSQELYFILNNETASNERKKVSEFGYKRLYDKAKYIFPYMSLLSIFSKVLQNDLFSFFNSSITSTVKCNTVDESFPPENVTTHGLSSAKYCSFNNFLVSFILSIKFIYLYLFYYIVGIIPKFNLKLLVTINYILIELIKDCKHFVIVTLRRINKKLSLLISVLFISFNIFYI